MSWAKRALILLLVSCQPRRPVPLNKNIAPPLHAVYALEAPSENADPRQEWRNEVARRLPQIRFAKSGPFLLQTPEWTSWLRTASSTGAVHLRLSLAKGAPSIDIPLPILLAPLLQLDKMPQYLPWITAPTELGRESFESSRAKYWFRLHSEYTTSPFRESCEYVDHWLRTQQLLRTPLRGDESWIELNCQFVLASSEKGSTPARNSPLTFTRLALPYIDGQTGEFPFKSVEESATYRYLRNLK